MSTIQHGGGGYYARDHVAKYLVLPPVCQVLGNFQKAESDLDYIQAMLEFEMMKGLPDGLSQEENPLVLVRQLSLVKSHYKTLCEQLEKISIERRESMRSIRATLAKTVKLVQEIQHHTGMEISPLSEEEQLAMQHLMLQTPEVTEVPAKQNRPKEHEIH